MDRVDIALEGAESQNSAHGTETIGWLAVRMSRATWNGRSYEAGCSATRANHQWWQLPFRGFFNEPRFMGALDTTNEGDYAHLRYQWLGSRHMNVRVEEDTTHDSIARLAVMGGQL